MICTVCRDACPTTHGLQKSKQSLCYLCHSLVADLKHLHRTMDLPGWKELSFVDLVYTRFQSAPAGISGWVWQRVEFCEFERRPLPVQAQGLEETSYRTQ